MGLYNHIHSIHFQIKKEKPIQGRRILPKHYSIMQIQDNYQSIDNFVWYEVKPPISINSFNFEEGETTNELQTKDSSSFLSTKN